MRNRTSILAAAWVSALAVLAACGTSSGSHDDAAQPAQPLSAASTPLPVETSPPAVYVAKVKNILVGLPPTDAEVKAVEADPSKLAALIQEWQQLPQYQTKMIRFFQLAFQQTQISDVDFTDQTFPQRVSINRQTTPLLVQNATESFARTMAYLVSQGHPLSEAMTTQSFMMTPALMEFYAFLDAWQVDDAGKVTDRMRVTHQLAKVTITGTQIPITDSLDPASPNFLTFTNPNLAAIEAAVGVPGCFTDPVVYSGGGLANVVQRVLQGSLDGRPNPNPNPMGLMPPPPPPPACPPIAGLVAGPLTPDDFATWKMVTTRAPKGSEVPTAFYELDNLRNSTELVLQVPRVGFFSTPAFFANWQTNTSNQMRVTVNQALIVGLGAAVDGTDATHPSSTPGLDPLHASSPACVSCHQTLDPTRSIFASQMSWNYHNQTDMAFSKQPGLFSFQGVTKPVASLEEFGATLASHPLFAQAWVQKLCYYANSRKCDAADPEVQRIVAAFTASHFDWNALVRVLMSSPITTNAKATKTLADEGEVIAVSRRDHLCAALDARLGFADICGLDIATVQKGKSIGTISEIVSGLPSDGYGRGAIAPVLPNAPSLFFRAGAENICGAVADLVIDPKAPVPGQKQWSSGAPSPAIADFVQTLMALTPSDPRSAPSVAALQSHFDAALKTGAAPTDALKSTFVVACLAPSAVSVGL